LIKTDGKGFRVNTKWVNCLGLRRYKENGKGYLLAPNSFIG